MSIVIDNDLDALYLNETLGDTLFGRNYSYFGWIKFTNKADVSNLVMFRINNQVGDRYHGLHQSAAGDLEATVDGSAGPDIAVTQGVWYAVGYTYDGSGNHRTYLGTESGALTLADTYVQTPIADSGDTAFVIGGNTVNAGRYNLAYQRIWDAVLSESELDAERYSATPVRSSNLFEHWPMANTGTADPNGAVNSINLRTNGTLTATTNPTLPTVASGKIISKLILLGIG